MREIIEYIENKYNPASILVYGSYADGSNSACSDFDCMIIVNGKSVSHDTSIVGGVQLDLFIYTLDEIGNVEDYSDFVQICDARIIKDAQNAASQLIEKVNGYILTNKAKPAGEKENLKAWMLKMLRRAEQNDIEGSYRYHWALTDSLEIYFILRDTYYFGPKKGINYLRKNDSIAHELFEKALRTIDYQCLKDWINYVVSRE